MERACFHRLKLKYDELLSNFAFNFNLRRYVVADAMYGDILRGCEVFSNASASLIAAIAVSMRVEVGPPP